MSNHSKHFKSLWRNEIIRTCPKKTCCGILIHCISTYIDHGPLISEWECTECGLIKKDNPGLKRKYNGQYSSQKTRFSQR